MVSVMASNSLGIIADPDYMTFALCHRVESEASPSSFQVSVGQLASLQSGTRWLSADRLFSIEELLKFNAALESFLGPRRNATWMTGPISVPRCTSP